jgi:hypothetical protein
VSDSSASEPSLSLDDGYLAAYSFIRQFYERDGRKPESMFFLLLWMQLEAPRMSQDPAQWSDWVRSVSEARERGTEVFSDPISDPLSQ